MECALELQFGHPCLKQQFQSKVCFSHLQILFPMVSKILTRHLFWLRINETFSFALGIPDFFIAHSVLYYIFKLKELARNAVQTLFIHNNFD